MHQRRLRFRSPQSTFFISDHRNQTYMLGKKLRRMEGGFKSQHGVRTKESTISKHCSGRSSKIFSILLCISLRVQYDFCNLNAAKIRQLLLGPHTLETARKPIRHPLFPLITTVAVLHKISVRIFFEINDATTCTRAFLNFK